MLNTDDIANDLGFCRTVVCRWIRDGRLKATKKDNHSGWMISEEDYKKFLDENQSLNYAHEGGEGSKKNLRSKKEFCSKIMGRIRNVDERVDISRYSAEYMEGWKSAMAAVEKIMQDEYGHLFQLLQMSFSSYDA